MGRAWYIILHKWEHDAIDNLANKCTAAMFECCWTSSMLCLMYYSWPPLVMYTRNVTFVLLAALTHSVLVPLHKTFLLSWHYACVRICFPISRDLSRKLVSVSDPKLTPARITFSILEAIYALDEVWGLDYPGTRLKDGVTAWNRTLAWPLGSLSLRIYIHEEWAEASAALELLPE